MNRSATAVPVNSFLARTFKGGLRKCPFRDLHSHTDTYVARNSIRDALINASVAIESRHRPLISHSGEGNVENFVLVGVLMMASYWYRNASQRVSVVSSANPSANAAAQLVPLAPLYPGGTMQNKYETIRSSSRASCACAGACGLPMNTVWPVGQSRRRCGTSEC